MKKILRAFGKPSTTRSLIVSLSLLIATPLLAKEEVPTLAIGSTLKLFPANTRHTPDEPLSTVGIIVGNNSFQDTGRSMEYVDLSLVSDQLPSLLGRPVYVEYVWKLRSSDISAGESYKMATKVALLPVAADGSLQDVTVMLKGKIIDPWDNESVHISLGIDHHTFYSSDADYIAYWRSFRNQDVLVTAKLIVKKDENSHAYLRLLPLVFAAE